MTGSIRIQWRKVVFLFALALFTTLFAIGGLTPLQAQPQQQNGRYTAQEIIDSGHRFFGDALLFALAIFTNIGLIPAQAQTQQQNGRYTAQEIIDSGHRFFGDAAGSMATGIEKVFAKYGLPNGYILGEEGSGAIYELDNVNNLWGRYAGISGSAYFVAGVGFHVLKKGNILLVPVRTGVGARLGVNIGYLKLTPAATWNPF